MQVKYPLTQITYSSFNARQLLFIFTTVSNVTESWLRVPRPTPVVFPLEDVVVNIDGFIWLISKHRAQASYPIESVPSSVWEISPSAN